MIFFSRYVSDLTSYLENRNYFEISDEELWNSVDKQLKYAAVDTYFDEKEPVIWMFQFEPEFKDHDETGELWWNDIKDEPHKRKTKFTLDKSLFSTSLRIRPAGL